MIKITDKTLCCGCTACVTVCPAQCIVLRRDREGFDYPVANPDRCIGCGKCEKVCPVLAPGEPSVPLEAMAVRNDACLEGSSSGGVFPSVAERIIEKGGVVYGAVLNDDMSVGHIDAEDMAGVERMRGSKYVQSDLYSVFDEVKDILSEGRNVLFSGTPCQVAGLRNYLGNRTEGLLTVDCACHGVPSPGLWEKYVKALETSEGGKIKYVKFRDKSNSWMHYDFVYDAGKGEVRTNYMKDPYMALFAQNMTLRPSCYSCPVRNGKSGSDLTLADLWSVADSAPELDDDRGVSLVLLNTEKGRGIMTETGLKTRLVDTVQAMKNNSGFAGKTEMPERREEFFKGHHSATDLVSYMKGFVVRKPLHVRLCRSLRSVLSGIKRRITG